MNHRSSESCATCRCYVNGHTSGECHAQPPRPELSLAVMSVVHVAWPPVPADGWCSGWQACPVVGQERDAWSEVERLKQERDEARRIVESLAERVAKQSELLSKKAERVEELERRPGKEGEE